MLVNLKEILTPAYAEHYAVGSFNCYSYETFRGVIAAGEETGTPVIAAFGAAYLANMSLETAHAIVASLAKEASVPVCFHLDHCSDMHVIYRAIKAGFGSVMYDGSMLPFAENVANTRTVCQVAHACGVSVEAELGSLAVGADSHEGRAEDVEQYTDPQAAREFVDSTEVDALAVSIGTVHGLYKGNPDIRTDILEEIHRAVDVPLVLHGGSGTPEDDLHACIARGIAKINVNTEISSAVVAQTAELLTSEKPHYSVLSLRQTDYVKTAVKKYIGIFGHS
ncbi:ketose-bisphosphate aldolase [Selenomonas sp. TAMA-11512]|uniref:class II fructose-bisphosphate aldolase n=1 Tax=Selenomonas sp. TAMA-11512 TaxID=3095337 RepID=UPI00308CAE99|nr:ketose-bisphosphate aldolase [Selenomonas sp. TAMA-11512]